MTIRENPRCPRCGFPLLEFSHQDIRIDECSGCEGLWLDSGELKHLARMPQRLLWSSELDVKWKHAQAWIKGTSEEEQARSRERHAGRCPRCDGKLGSETLYGVEIDRCSECGGVWLDKGELIRLEGTEPGFLARLLKRLLG